jgi:hypothetical protein
MMGRRNLHTLAAANHPKRTSGYSCVYVIGPTEGAPIKIGCAANPKIRLSQFQAGNWNKLSILFHTLVLDGKLGERVVSRCHELLDRAGKRIDRDWFDVPLDRAKKVIEVAARHQGIHLYTKADLKSLEQAKQIDDLNRGFIEQTHPGFNHGEVIT